MVNPTAEPLVDRMLVIRHLRYLAALAREKHFGRAAAACCVTQPTLSGAIKQLEDKLGVPIVERGQRFEGFTPEGDRVLDWARRILADCDGLTQEVREMRGELVGNLRLGVIPSTVPMVSLLTTPLMEMHPGLSVHIEALSSEAIQQKLDAFELDAGLTYLENEPLARVRVCPIFSERYVLFTSRLGRFADRETITWAEAADLDLCVLSPDMQNRRILDGMFRKTGRTPRMIVETNSVLALCSHIRFGHWATILPDSFLHLFGEIRGAWAIPLVEPDAEQLVGLTVADRDPISPMAQALITVAERLDIRQSLRRYADQALEVPISRRF